MFNSVLDNPHNLCTNSYVNIKTLTLTSSQKRVYDYFLTITNDNINKQDLVYIIGSAGTGKTYLIKIIRSLLRHKLLICATTGKAAVNIGDYVQTLHKSFKLPITRKQECDLSDKVLKEFQKEYKLTELLLIDEISMMSQLELYWLNKRLKQIKINDEIFGGISIILVGDLFQLPPVKGIPLYSKNSNRIEDFLGYNLYQKFNKIFILDKIMRQHNETSPGFVELLERLRIGSPVDSDWTYLSKNFIKTGDYDDETRRLKLYATNKDALSYNLK